MQKILYVEDDLSLIDGLKYTLENSGYFVDNARTASEALARFKQDTYDLLLLDPAEAMSHLLVMRYGCRKPSEISLKMRWNIHGRVVTFPCSGHDRRS